MNSALTTTEIIMIKQSSFKPAWWLFNRHAQTIYPTLTRTIEAPVNRMERLELHDGDFIDLAWAEKGLAPTSPLVIILHGLGGNIHSKYAAGLMYAFNQRGWRAVLMHFRGASNEPNRLPRAYHSGETGDLDLLLRTLADREPNTKKAVVGFSLGGNVLLKWLGEQGTQALVETAVAVSVPFKLRIIADQINRGFSRCYQNYLLKKLRTVFARKWEKYQNPLNLSASDLEKINCFWTFDEKITAPLHGFAHVHDYYRQSSSIHYLQKIATPTLVLHALDDPFMTPEILPNEEELSPAVTLEVSQRGGHVGFITGNTLGKPVYWLEQRIPEHLLSYFD
jgi:predicted alpha/beta-fold hydrolase